MKKVVLLALAAHMAAACSSGMRIFRRPAPEAGADSLYWRAVAQLDPFNPKPSLDSALSNLERYLAGPKPARRREALVLRQLTQDAKQLARVELALQQARSDSTQTRAHTSTEAEPRRRDDEALLKEIQRLKEELAKANEELDRIRKRLANPKPPGV